MKVIFLEDVPGTADAGEVKDVKNGFARNYLLPRKLAAPATRDQLQRINTIEREAQTKRTKRSSEASVVAVALDGQAVTIAVRAGPTGRLFGSVTSRHIAEELNKLTDGSLDHRSILLSEAIREPGDYDVGVRLYRDVVAQVKVRVVPEGYVPADAPEAVVDAAQEAPEAAAQADEAQAAQADEDEATQRAGIEAALDEAPEPSEASEAEEDSGPSEEDKQ